MPQLNVPLYSLNAGIASRYGLGRIDLAKMRIAAEVQQNLIPMVLGPAIFRPGTEYMTRTLGNLAVKLVPFVFNAETKALIEVSVNYARILIDGQPLERPAVTSALLNGDFGAAGGWIDADEVGAVSDITGGTLRLTGTGTSFAKRYQQLTINQVGTEHAIRIVVLRGPVVFAVGSTPTGENIIAETVLRTGSHSIAFTPSVATVYVQLKSDADAIRVVTTCDIEAAGVVTLPHNWGVDFQKIRYAQSADVMFVACEDRQQQRIERRDQHSWSICDYNTLDGPFRAMNESSTTLQASARTGNITLTANRGPMFHIPQEGALFRLTHFGQSAAATLTGDDQFSDSIRVTGVSTPADANTRPFTINVLNITGTGTTVTLQRSFGEEGNWNDVESYTIDITHTINDGFDNQIVFYRLGIKSGDYASGSIDVSLLYSSGSQQGVVRITAVVSTIEATAEVISTIGTLEATTSWEEGEWSDYRGFPSSVAFHDGRLWWGWKDRVFGSVSDAFTSYDDNVEGDSGPVIRSVATGPIEGIRWLLSLQRLLAGTASQEVSMRSSSFDEPITPTQFTARNFATRGCFDIQSVDVDGRCIYVQRNQKRVYVAGIDPNAQDYASTDLTRLVPDLLAAGIVDIAVQRQPDTRVWFVLANGTVALLTFEPADEVVAWSTIVTDGTITAVGILPGQDEDEVYIAVQRTIASGTIRAIERFATLGEVIGGVQSKNVDSHTIYSGTPTTEVNDLAHLAGASVKVWADGAPLPDAYTVNNSGVLTLPAEYSDIVVGRSYEGRFKSSKLASGAVTGTAVGKRRRVDHAALMMADVAWHGVRTGRDFNNMTRLNATLGNGRPLASSEVIADYDYEGSPFNGGWGPDERFCFSIASPYCGQFLGVAIQMATNDPAIYGTRPAGS